MEVTSRHAVRWGVLVFAAGLVVWLMTGGPSAPSAPDADTASPGSEAADAKEAPGLRARAAPQPEVDTPAPSPDPAAAVQPVAVDAMLRGELVGFASDEKTPARVSVTGIGGVDPWLPASVAEASVAGGRFALDVGPLLAGEGQPFEFEVRVEHAHYMPAKARVLVGEQAAQAGRRRTWTVRIEVVRAGLISGQAIDSDGQPFVGATAAVYAFEAGGPRMQAIDQTTTPADGAFRLRIGTSGPYLVVVAAKGLRPASAKIHLHPGDTLELEPSVLREGLRIAGTVTVNGEIVEGAGVELRARGARRVYLRDQRILWLAGEVFAGGTEVLTQADGSFAFEGLDARTYQLQVARLPRMAVHPDLEETLDRAVAAPDENVRVEVEVARLTVTVQSGGEPLEGAMVSVAGESGSSGTSTSADGQRTFHLPWGASYSLEVTEDEYETYSQSFRTDRATWEADRVVELERKRPQPSLLVRIADESGKPVTSTGIGLYRVGKDTRHPYRREDYEDSEKGLFRVTHLEPGPLRVVVRPGGQWWWGTQSLIEAEQVVEVPVQGEASVRFTAARGGRIRIAVSVQDGRSFKPRCRVLDADGKKLPVTFVQLTQAGRSGSAAYLDSSAPSLVHPALPAGTYRLEFSGEGLEPQTRDVTVRVGETKELDVRLQRKKP